MRFDSSQHPCDPALLLYWCLGVIYRRRHVCVCVCTCVLGPLPLLTGVRCGHSISQLLTRIDAAFLFEFNSQPSLFQHAPAPPEGPYDSLSFSAFASFNQPKVARRRSRTVTAAASNSLPITFDPHLCLAPGCIDILASCCLLKFFPESTPPPHTETRFFESVVQQLISGAVCERQAGDVDGMNTLVTELFHSDVKHVLSLSAPLQNKSR